MKGQHKKPVIVTFTRDEFDALCSAVSWVRSAGDYSEWAEGSTPAEQRAFEAAAARIRTARRLNDGLGKP